MRHRAGLVHQGPVAQGEIMTTGTRVLLAAPLRSELGLFRSDGGLPVADSRHADAVESTIESLASSDGQLLATTGVPSAAFDLVCWAMTVAGIAYLVDSRTDRNPR